MNKGQALELIESEYQKAIKKFPSFPVDIIHQVNIQAEESGEAVKAASEHFWAGGDIKRVEQELAHAGAMAIRCLIHLCECRADETVKQILETEATGGNDEQ